MLQQFGNSSVSKPLAQLIREPANSTLSRNLRQARALRPAVLALLQFLCALFTAIAMGLALSHALELPGKLRLNREQYFTVQAIYYPGFTIGGAAEPLAIIALAASLLIVPAGSDARWLVGLALVAAIGTQVLFWTVVQPVNRAWLKSTPLGSAEKRFFGTDANSSETAGWTRLRNRWELGHLTRTVTATAAFVLTILAIIAPRLDPG